VCEYGVYVCVCVRCIYVCVSVCVSVCVCVFLGGFSDKQKFNSYCKKVFLLCVFVCMCASNVCMCSRVYM